MQDKAVKKVLIPTIPFLEGAAFIANPAIQMGHISSMIELLATL